MAINRQNDIKCMHTKMPVEIWEFIRREAYNQRDSMTGLLIRIITRYQKSIEKKEKKETTQE